MLEVLKTLGQDLVRVAPTLLISVPRIYEKIQARIYKQLSGVKKVLFQWSMNVGLQFIRTDKPSFGLRLKRKIADRLVFS